MQVDPQAQMYGPILEETEEQRKAFEQAVKEGKVVARSDSHEQLKILQDDLRKAGYRKQR